MTLWLAVDPGVINAGVAFFKDHTLVDAWLQTSLCWRDTARDIRDELSRRHAPWLENLQIAIEVPQIYTGAKQKGRQSDLIDVTLMAGMLLGVMQSFTAGVQVFQPAEWKGSVPKEVTEARVRERLSPDELARVRLPKAKRLQHNVYDAIGIGMYAQGRL